MVGREANVTKVHGRTLREIEPVSVLSNGVSSNKIWISKMHEQRLAREFSPKHGRIL